MALRQVMIDDLDLTEGAETRTFSLDGVTYEIDLNDKNHQMLTKALGPFIDSGRRQPTSKGKPKAETPKPMGRTRVMLSKEQNDAIRQWARKRGHQVSSRGRIPADIVDKFQTEGVTPEFSAT